MEHLKDLRTAQKLTQKQMADYLGVDRTTYVKYETDRSEPTFDTLQKLADYFGVTVDFLMGREKTEKPAVTTDDELKFALFGGTASDAQFEEVKRFAQFVKERDRRDKCS